MNIMSFFKKKPDAAKFPRPLESIFYDTHECPDCGGKDFDTSEDGGGHSYEVRFFCKNCHSAFGLQLTFRLIDRVDNTQFLERVK